MNKVIIDKCKCGEEVHIELNRFDCSRVDGKRPFYPNEELPSGLDPKKYSMNNSTSFRCRNCGAWLGHSVKSASFDN